MANILIVNFGSTLNKGSAAILNGKIKCLSDLILDAKFTILTYPWGLKDSLEALGQDAYVSRVPISGQPKILMEELLLAVLLLGYNLLSPIPLLNIRSLAGKQIQSFAKKYTPGGLVRDACDSFLGYSLLVYCGMLHLLARDSRAPRRLYPRRLWAYYDADLVLNTGGDVLTEDYADAISYFSNILFSIFLNRPFAIYAESIGPFNHRINKTAARYILNRAKLITLRDEISLRHLHDLGIDKPSIYLTADVAFTLQPASEKRIEEIMADEGLVRAGLNKQKPLIGISVSKIIAAYGFPNSKSSSEKYDQYTMLMSRVVDYLADQFDALVVFVPHVYGPADTDDRLIADDICKNIKNKSKVISIKNEYSPEELKGIIGACDLFIGARMHAMIASTSMCVPTVAIAYSHKTHGIIGKMLGQDRYLLDIKDLSYDNLICAINSAWENRESVHKDLNDKMPGIRDEALMSGRLVRNIL